jgi:hypothetical protein
MVPNQWKAACIVPVPKIPQPIEPADYRPISVTPILSRCLERFVVKQYFYPLFTDPTHAPQFKDQFAFRPTGSTTAALSTILQTITEILDTEPYVCVYALDFSKAFDTVRHASLLHRVHELGFPDSIFNWLCSFVGGRVHCTKFNGSLSSSSCFNAGVVQGSAIGPAAYVLCASELQPKFATNKLFKYADDSYLIVPASNVHTVKEEIANISLWSGSYNLKLNIKKCKEMVVCTSRRAERVPLPAPGTVPGVERVDSLVMLGIKISDRLTMDGHITDLLTTANQSMFALRTLKRTGLSDEVIWAVCRATLVAKLQYGSPAWWGFANRSHIDCLEGALRRASRWGLYPQAGPSLTTIALNSDISLFKKVLGNSNHVMHSLLPPIKITPYSLRPRAHDRVLPLKTTTLAKNFIYRLLYNGQQ